MAMARQVIRTRPQYASGETIENCRNLVFDNDETDFDACSSDQVLQLLVIGKINTLMTDRGLNSDLSETGLHKAISKAGFTPLN